MKKKKPFSCNQECKSNCCSRIVVHVIEPRGKKMDTHYLGLHGIEHKPEELDMTEVNRVLDTAIKESKMGMVKGRMIKMILPKLIRIMFKQYALNIPCKCDWLQEDGKCFAYGSRPDVCKKGSYDKAFPIEDCPY